MNSKRYLRFAAMIGLSYLAMYAFMYSMANTRADLYLNLPNAYMAALMTAPMVLFEMLLMGGMYARKKLNGAIMAASVVAMIGFWLAIRTEAGVRDAQFLKSMIPHHSAAILMCGASSISDAEIRDLCRAIVTSQQREIDQMKAILARLDAH